MPRSTDSYYAVYYTEWLGTAGSLLLIMSVGYTVSRLSNRRQEGGSPCRGPLTATTLSSTLSGYAVVRPSGNPSVPRLTPTNPRSSRSGSARRFLGSIGRVWGAARLMPHINQQAVSRRPQYPRSTVSVLASVLGGHSLTSALVLRDRGRLVWARVK